MSEAAAAAVERLREKLIDLSANNRLLNFRHGAGVPGSQSALRFVGRPADRLFARLEDQKSLAVQPVPAPSDRELDQFYSDARSLPGLESEALRSRAKPDAERWARYLGWDVSYELPRDADGPDGENHRDAARIRTLLYPEQLEARLRRLRSNARLAIEESGSNMLFLAFGFLEWFDKSPRRPGDDVRPYHAPLVLMPASIDTETNARGVRSLAVSWTGEDLQLNLSLKRKLALDFGIDLPDFADDDSPETYFDRIRRAIAAQPQWKVRWFVTLTLFANLGKLLLYLDLDPDKWPKGGGPADHPIVRSLVGDGYHRTRAARPPMDDRQLAKIIDLDLCLVDRADRTQAEAVLEALNGEDLVIQGPPGTGKSQTITNLIAAAMDRGKTVLFVAEKLAALEVVRRRLREVGLGDFCLELHSHKTRKKAFFDDLQARLARNPTGAPAEFNNALAALVSRRSDLDSYASAVGRPAGRTGLTVADLLFEGGRLRAEQPALVRVVDESRLAEQVGALLDTLSISAYSDRETVDGLKAAARAMAGLSPFGGPLNCPWRGVRAQALAIDAPRGLECLTAWRNAARAAAQATNELNLRAGTTLGGRLSDLGEARKLGDCPLDLPAVFKFTAAVEAVLAELRTEFGLPLERGVVGLSQAARLLRLINSASHEALAYGHQGLDSEDATATLKRLSTALHRRAQLLVALEGRIEKPDRIDHDEQKLRAAAKLLKESGLFARLGRDWREARRLARGLSASGAPNKPAEQGAALLLLGERVAVDREIEDNPEFRIACGVHFRGAATEVEGLRRALEWRCAATAEFRDRRENGIRDALFRLLPNAIEYVRDNATPPITELARHISQILAAPQLHFRVLLGIWAAIARSVTSGALSDALASRESEEEVEELMLLVRRAAAAASEWEDAQRRATRTLSIDAAVWFSASEEPTTEQVVRRAEEALEAAEALNPWLAYARARDEVQEPGAKPLLAAMENGSVDPNHIEPAWRIAWLTDATRKLHGSEPVLLRFAGLRLDGIRREYARLDADVMEMRRRAIAARLALRRPPEGVRSPRIKEMTELALLARCIAMERRHPAIRNVTARAGKALQALKPCFMMGPLSVAQYLAPGALSFDLVIMDEASQIRPEDAIGAVARGGQLVVVGDDKQLPPTSFFERVSADAEGREGPDGDDRFVGQTDESVLTLASGSLSAGRRMLGWHYRSRHPELIAFSNHQFYDGKLVVFPAPRESDAVIGLTRELVEDGSAVDGINDAEARRVAQAAVDHLRSQPNKSLMVAAMSIRQKERIDEHIAKLGAANGDLGRILDESEAETRIEPFVVKNLENVQGDERDVVMISMTYGPRVAGGKVEQYFGPINQEKGHRRLNVLFTRAKERMAVFTSMRSTDIRAGLESGPGVQALHGFLRFAETKRLPADSRLTGRPSESPFEEAVKLELEHAGYTVEPQLGVGSYRIDIAVRDPDFPQHFLLGIECDGAMYHSTLSARDRDRLRQEVLENLGWEIERIWSVDWFRDPAREIKRVLDRLDHLRRGREGPSPEGPPPGLPPDTAGLAEDAPVYRPPTDLEGVPAARVASISRRGLNREEVRAALIALREKIERDCPNADPTRGLLRQNMLEELLRKRPIDIDEFQAKIPLDLRLHTDGEQFKKYSDEVFDLLAGAA